MPVLLCLSNATVKCRVFDISDLNPVPRHVLHRSYLCMCVFLPATVVDWEPQLESSSWSGSAEVWFLLCICILFLPSAA